ncbi:dTDP-4-dehydrorhamnose reductase [Halomonas sp. ZH2S]|uniref:dTDP-4-dehydrorhamnose reductase n=1 Tax=Vreelandella zhuhanensis TaxID=2684210 RepID=A0A7X3KR52_9GAMM|nr:dTDP-4-dehydrorhamnose reductase [Halomonas zhuhanensis]MWJ27642.1 dTDP-4-dehydrorhamnose reductase [Halomonas zhuhanensis]
MHVLVTGATGQVGYELLRLAPEDFTVAGFGSAQLDITDAAAVEESVARETPALIINAAAYTAVDKAEAEPELAYAANRDGVANLAAVAARRGIPLLHISTDYVFAGDAKTPYREDETPAPTGVYGASKLAGEQVLAETCASHLIMRTSWVFGAHGNNFVKTMLRLGQEREKLSVVADQHGCPTSAASIARALWALVEQYRDQGTLQWGLYHYAGLPPCTWHDFAKNIFDIAHELGLISQKPMLVAIGTEDFPTPAKRPAWSVLDSCRLKRVHGIGPSDWPMDLRDVLTELRSLRDS